MKTPKLHDIYKEDEQWHTDIHMNCAYAILYEGITNIVLFKKNSSSAIRYAVVRIGWNHIHISLSAAVLVD